MAGLLLCSPQTAENPYFIGNVSLNIYSIEELCYYLYHNIYLIDESILNEGLCDWIGRELGQGELARKLRPCLAGQDQTARFVGHILRSTGYCSQAEAEELETLLQELENKSEFYKRKLRADNFIKNNKNISGIYEYFQLLGLQESEEVPEEIYGAVLHNLGVAHAKLFLFRQAAYYFNEAYKHNMNQQTFREHVFALRLCNNEQAYQEKLEKYGISRAEAIKVENELKELMLHDNADIEHDKLENVKRYRKNGQTMKYLEELEGILQEWKQEYCRSII